MYEIRHYVDENGCDLFAEWREQLRNAKARIAVDRRIMRMELGNFGDHKALREGVWDAPVGITGSAKIKRSIFYERQSA